MRLRERVIVPRLKQTGWGFVPFGLALIVTSFRLISIAYKIVPNLYGIDSWKLVDSWSSLKHTSWDHAHWFGIDSYEFPIYIDSLQDCVHWFGRKPLAYKLTIGNADNTDQNYVLHDGFIKLEEYLRNIWSFIFSTYLSFYLSFPSNICHLSVLFQLIDR